MQVAMIQFSPHSVDKVYNLQKVRELIEEAVKHDPCPDLILLPETWNSCYLVEDDVKSQAEQCKETIDGESISMLREMAEKHNVWIGSGSITLKEDEKCFNAMFLINRKGEIVSSYRKVHLCGWVNEDDVFSYGEDSVTVETEIGKLGMIICYDVRFAEWIRINALNGAEVLMIPACFCTSLNHWRNLVTTRAIENQMYVMGCNCCGGHSVGHSMIVAPDGTVLAEAGEEEEILYAELKLDAVKKTRDVVKYLADRRPDVYKKYNIV